MIDLKRELAILLLCWFVGLATGFVVGRFGGRRRPSVEGNAHEQ